VAKKFALQLKAFSEKVLDRMDFVVRKIGLDLDSRLVMRSPVGDGDQWEKPPPPGYVGGRFRANWIADIGSPNLETTDDADPSGSATNKRNATKIMSAKAGDVLFLTNSLPYSIALEEGHSRRQAPEGIVAVTLLEFPGIVAVAARAAQRERT